MAPPKRPQKKLMIAIVAVVVVVVVVLAVVLIFYKGSSSSSSSGSQSFSSESSTAAGIASSHGYNQFMLATGLEASYSFTENNTTNLTCGPAGNVSYPSTTVTGNGYANLWEFVYANAQNSTYIVFIENGNVKQSFSVPSFCGFVSDLRPIPSNVIDSTAAASVAAKNGGSGFLTNHSSDSVLYYLASSSEMAAGPLWGIEYDPCAGGPGTNPAVTGEQPIYEVLVNATSGTLYETPMTNTVDCSKVVQVDTIGLAGGVPSASACTGAASMVYYEIVYVGAISATITTGMFGFKTIPVTGGLALATTSPGLWTSTSGGACPSAGWWAVLESITGTPLAYWDSSGNGVWTATANGTTPVSPAVTLTVGQTLVVSMCGENPADPAGAYTMQAYGINGNTVSGSVDL
jgi:hypothetical protein